MKSIMRVHCVYVRVHNHDMCTHASLQRFVLVGVSMAVSVWLLTAVPAPLNGREVLALSVSTATFGL